MGTYAMCLLLHWLDALQENSEVQLTRESESVLSVCLPGNVYRALLWPLRSYTQRSSSLKRRVTELVEPWR